MKTQMRNLLAIVVCSLCTATFAFGSEQCDDPDAPEQIRIYFANGMNNEPKDIWASFIELRSLIGSSSSRNFGRSINTKEGFLRQLLQVFSQRTSEPSKYWEWISDMGLAPQWFKDAFGQYTYLVSNISYSLDAELRLMVAEYLQDLNSGKKVIIVSHSQGNFYSNLAYQYIKDNYPKYKNSIGIVAVGTPASRVQGGGAHTTNSLDLVINLVRQLYKVLPANITYDEPNDILNHNFINTYLAAAGVKIRSDVYKTINRLVPPVKAAECEDAGGVAVNVDTTAATNIMKTSARMNGTVISGKNIDAWINWKEGSAPQSCASIAGSQNGTGTFNTGDPIILNKTGLKKGTTYFYRVCGKGTKNRISDGGSSSFKTKEAPVIIQTLSGDTSYGKHFKQHFVQYKGRLSKGSDVDIWFVHSRGKYSIPRCSGTKIGTSYTSGRASAVVNFSTWRKASGGWDSGFSLFANANTTYRFRACASKNYATYSGEIMSVKTQSN